MFNRDEKLLLLAAVMLGWLCFMVFQTVRNLGGHWPVAPNVRAYSPVAARVHRAKHIAEPFSLAVVSNFKPARNLSNPFYPNPSQPPPPPPQPSTRAVDMVYQGFYRTSQGEKQAYLMVADKFFIGTVGSKVAGNFVVADIALQQVTLQDPAGKKSVLEFRVKKTLEAPIQ